MFGETGLYIGAIIFDCSPTSLPESGQHCILSAPKSASLHHITLQKKLCARTFAFDQQIETFGFDFMLKALTLPLLVLFGARFKAL